MTVPDELEAVFVSMVEIHGKRYISGIRFQGKGGGDSDHSSRLGYIRRREEIMLADSES